MKVCHYQRRSKENAANTESDKKQKNKKEEEKRKGEEKEREREVGNKDIYTGNASLGQVHGLLR